MEKRWWKEEVIYQIYPRSFMDSNGDGIGDLQGVISKLDYLKELGIDIIWMSPIYESPNDDNGYDISDYYNIHPEFGSMDDFDELLAGLKERNLKIIMDLVVNHTSDEHEWFKQSRSSKDNPYRDFYIWKEGKGDHPPNNWPSFFGGDAWEYDEATGEYYLHLFTKKQPDLNWENPKVREEIKKLLKYWLDKGIDGFRMDVIPLISKHQDFPDATTLNFVEVVEKVYSNGPRVHEFLQELYTDVLQHYDIMTVGEGPGISKDVGLNYVGHDRGELNMIFHLDHMFLGHGPQGKFDPIPYGWPEIKKIFREWDEAMGDSGWISIFMDNHDFPRLVSRFGNDQEYRLRSAKLLAMMILTLRGTPCIYQGSEIGMTNVKFDKISEYRDVETLNFFKDVNKLGVTEEKFLELVHENGRDNVRTPLHWNNELNAGFSSNEPWIKVNPNYPMINLESDLQKENSLFRFYQKLLTFRKKHSTLIYGKFIELDPISEKVFAYSREDEDGRFVIILNHSDEAIDIDFGEKNMELVFKNMENDNELNYQPWEARIYKNME